MEFDGVIQGGWNYVAAAYGLSFAILIAYTLIVSFRLRGLRQRKEGR